MDEDGHESARRRMLDEIAADAARTAEWTGRDRFSDRVMWAMNQVPRHEFIAEGDEAASYVNRPRPIGHKQTISQPYIVALMTDLLDLSKGARVLEIGTGSGYQAAVLSLLVKDVYSIETVPALAAQATERLATLGYDNVHVRLGDGYNGWPEEAPFDAIIVTAAPRDMPDGLVAQLAPKGRMAVPIGPSPDHQSLTLVSRSDSGEVKVRGVLPVAFVPMVPGKSAG